MVTETEFIVQLSNIGLVRALPDRHNPHRNLTIEQQARRPQQVRIVLLRPEVRHRADNELVFTDTQFGTDIIASRLLRSDGIDINPVPQRHNVGCSAPPWRSAPRRSRRTRRRPID